MKMETTRVFKTHLAYCKNPYQKQLYIFFATLVLHPGCSPGAGNRFPLVPSRILHIGLGGVGTVTANSLQRDLQT